jgi:hypothetical protein
VAITFGKRTSQLTKITTLEASDLIEVSEDLGGGAFSSKSITVEDFVASVGSISAIAVTNHGDLSGLLADDHPQYILVDGTRGFTGVVSGITPTLSSHLTTKGYVDTNIAVLSATIILLQGNVATISGDVQILNTNVASLSSSVLTLSTVSGLVYASSNDTTAGTLIDKLSAGPGITITELNDGGNESLLISSTGSGAAGTVVSGDFTHDTFTLALSDSVNRYVTLTSPPIKNSLHFKILDGPHGLLDQDYVLSAGNIINWAASELSSLLTSGETITINYVTT